MRPNVEDLKKRTSYSLRFKRIVVKHALEISKNDASKKFNISRSNVIRWCDSIQVLDNQNKVNRETRRINNTDENSQKNSAQNPECEKLLHDWFVEQRAGNIGVGTLSLLNKMNIILKEIKPTNPIKASRSWLQRFMKRYNLSNRRISGSGRAFPSNLKELISNYFNEIDNILSKKKYKAHEIFNFDESCFRIDSPSSTTISKVGARKTYSKSTGKEKAK